MRYLATTYISEILRLQEGHLPVLNTYKTLISFKVRSSDYNALVIAVQSLLGGLMKVIQNDGVEDPCHRFFHLLNVFKSTAPEVLLLQVFFDHVTPRKAAKPR